MIPLTPLALFRDWYIFYQAGRAINNGISPYLVEDYLNPIQIAWFLSLTTRIPFNIWVMLMIGASFLLIVVLAKRKSHWVLLSLPFIFGMSMGSLDVFLWVPARLLGGGGLALLTLKPQIGMLIIPLQLLQWWYAKDKKNIISFFAATIILWGIPTLLHPQWLREWLSVIPPIQERMFGAASVAGFSELTGYVWVYIAIFTVVLAILILRRSDKFYLAAIFSPSIWPSDWMILSEYATWRFTLLSWLLVPTGLSHNGAQFYWLLGVLVYFEQHPSYLPSFSEVIARFRIKK